MTKTRTIGFANNGNEFFAELRKEVEAYFQAKNISKFGNLTLWSKTVFVLIAVPLCYGVALFAGVPMWATMLLFLAIGVLHAFMGFNVMHDACHGSYSSKPWVNKLMSHSMHLLGSDAHIWKFKHNVLHHTWTNIDGIDDDIAKSPVLRHCESQPIKPAHKFQHWYMFGLYGISTIWWMFGNDMIKYFKGEVNERAMPKMGTYEHLLFWVTKITYALVYIAVPVYVLGWFWGIMSFVVLHIALGILLSVVFQLAHAVEHCHFDDLEAIEPDQTKMPNEWAVHQMMTTSNFSTQSAFAKWFTGGLNFQVEHHLFPQISHVHYPKINEILRRVANKYGVEYKEYPKFGQAVASHVRWMKSMGQPQLA